MAEGNGFYRFRFVADMTLLLSEVKLKPPEDYSGTSTITTSVTSREDGADRKPADN